VNVSTPQPADAARCTVAPIPGKDPKTPMGYVVRDAAGRPVRQFVSYDGKSFNIIAFYVDGAEAYREVYPPESNQAYQFRWLGANGTKWGLDKDRDGRIDEWVVISPEELSQELLQAVLNRDPKRVEALTLNKANLDSIGLQGAEAQKLLDRAAGVAGRINKAADELKAAPGAEWVHLQLGIPQTTPGDAIGARDDLVIHRTGTVIVKDGANSKTLQTGELVQIGRAWKLLEGPVVGAVGEAAGPSPVIPEIQDLVAELDKTDRNPPGTSIPEIAAHNAKRAAVLEQIVARIPADKQQVRETWTRLLLDSHSAAAESGKTDGPHLVRLKQFKEAFAGKPGNIGAYAWFRYLLTEHSIAQRDAKPGELQQLQEKWRTDLEEFVKANPGADDTPEATLRLGMAYEFLLTKEGDAKAKEWYDRLAKNHAGHPHAAKAAGAVKRLESEGKTLEVSGPTLANGQPFSTSSLAGKVVVVYYCANWSSTLPDDARKLRSLVKEYGPKGLELVVVSLDNDARTASETVAAHQLPGTVLFAPGGLDNSPLAAQYGVLVAPQIFIANKEGKVVTRNAQAANLDDEVKKLLP
jgi:peroxiredoxin